MKRNANSIFISSLFFNNSLLKCTNFTFSYSQFELVSLILMTGALKPVQWLSTLFNYLMYVFCPQWCVSALAEKELIRFYVDFKKQCLNERKN